MFVDPVPPDLRYIGCWNEIPLSDRRKLSIDAVDIEVDYCCTKCAEMNLKFASLRVSAHLYEMLQDISLLRSTITPCQFAANGLQRCQCFN